MKWVVDKTQFMETYIKRKLRETGFKETIADKYLLKMHISTYS